MFKNYINLFLHTIYVINKVQIIIRTNERSKHKIYSKTLVKGNIEILEFVYVALIDYIENSFLQVECN